jgi:Protein of unknown function (DUF3300)
VTVDRTFIKSYFLAFILCISALLSVLAWADDQELTYSISFTGDELDNLLAPIALYPDPLLAQILPASTYPTEIADAEAWLNSGGDISGIDEQEWDESVKAIAHYQTILEMMAENMDWTASLGDAFINQPEDVMGSIQRLRQQAINTDNLVGTNEQSVTTDGGYIEIIPAQPEYMYIPQYDPLIVYRQRRAPGMPSFVTFHPRLAIGGWLDMDFEWDLNNIIYHGWNRPGWVNNAKPYVHIRNVYINDSRPYIYQAWSHDASHGDPERYLASHLGGPTAGSYARTAEVRGSTKITTSSSGVMFGPTGDTTAYSNRGRESRGTVNQFTAPPVQSISHRSKPPKPQVSSNYSQPNSDNGSVQPDRSPSITFGGYRGSDEAREQSLRGQASRQSSAGVRSSSTQAGRGGAPAGRSTSRGR